MRQQPWVGMQQQRQGRRKQSCPEHLPRRPERSLGNIDSRGGGTGLQKAPPAAAAAVRAGNSKCQQQVEQQQTTTGGAQLAAEQVTEAVTELAGGGGSASALTDAAVQEAQQQRHADRETVEEGGAVGQLVCSHCGSVTSGSGRWARHPTTRERLCCSCRQYMRNHGGEEKPLGVRCLRCASSSPGPRSNWQQHPTTGQRWLCKPCFLAARRQARQASGQQAYRQPEGQGKGQHDRQQAGGRSSGQPERRCRECHASSPGRSMGADWHQHPAAALEWLCEGCFRGGVQQRRHRRLLEARQGDAAFKPPAAHWSSHKAPADESAPAAAQGKRQAKRLAQGGNADDGRAGAKRQRQHSPAKRGLQQSQQPGGEVEEAEGVEEGGDALQAAPRQQEPQQTPDLFSLLLETAQVPAAAACGLTPELATSYCEQLDGLSAKQRTAKVGVKVCSWTRVPPKPAPRWQSWALPGLVLSRLICHANLFDLS